MSRGCLWANLFLSLEIPLPNFRVVKEASVQTSFISRLTMAIVSKREEIVMRLPPTARYMPGEDQ
jgi:hypothetical protein